MGGSKSQQCCQVCPPEKQVKKTFVGHFHCHRHLLDLSEGLKPIVGTLKDGAGQQMNERDVYFLYKTNFFNDFQEAMEASRWKQNGVPCTNLLPEAIVSIGLMVGLVLAEPVTVHSGPC